MYKVKKIQKMLTHCIKMKAMLGKRLYKIVIHEVKLIVGQSVLVSYC